VTLAAPIYPTNLSAELRDLIGSLLQPDVTRRLGCTFGGSEAIKEHRWYKRGWSTHSHTKPPIVPAGSSMYFEAFANAPVERSDVDIAADVFAAF
jgi:hypothetical protein